MKALQPLLLLALIAAAAALPLRAQAQERNQPLQPTPAPSPRPVQSQPAPQPPQTVLRRQRVAPLPGGLDPGPLDDESWTLLAANGAVAAKLRQLQPRIEQTLCSAGWPARALRIRISPA